MHDAPLSQVTEPGTREGTTILKLSGPLTLANLFGFQEDFRMLTPPVLILDLTGVTYMDSAGLGILINAHVSAENQHRRFLLACINERVMTLLRLTRLDQVLKVYPSVAVAEAAV